MKTNHFFKRTLPICVAMLVLTFIQCTKDDPGAPLIGENTFSESSTVWEGTRITFKKANGADPTLAVNQDRLTDKVWLTRGNDGKQLYNIRKNTTANKATSPVGTAWALGTLDNVKNLKFNTLRETAGGKPKSLVGKNMVLHLKEDDIYLNIKFTSWSEDKKGGFAYERSTGSGDTGTTGATKDDTDSNNDSDSDSNDDSDDDNDSDSDSSDDSDDDNDSDSDSNDDSDDDNDSDSDSSQDSDGDSDDDDDSDHDDDDHGNGNTSGNAENLFDASAILWEGANLTFTKPDGADPVLETNQDRLTDNVWITRGNSGGQIFNIAKNSNATKSTSPVGTEWALGTIDQGADLTFKNFRDVGKPKSLVGKDMVVHLIADNIYLSIKFTDWSEGKSGGFAYERSTP